MLPVSHVLPNHAGDNCLYLLDERERKYREMQSSVDDHVLAGGDAVHNSDLLWFSPKSEQQMTS